MKQRKNVLIVCILLLLISIVFVACGTDSTSGPEADATTESTLLDSPTTGTTAPSADPTEPDHTHTWTEWETVTEATCTATGSRQRSCDCGENETQTINMLAHTEVVDAAVEPTCTETGLTEGKHCSVCNTVIVAQTTIAANGHNFQNGVCACGALQNSGTFQIIESIPLTSTLWSNGSTIAGGTDEGYFLYDTSGNLLAGPFDNIYCPDPDGYVVAKNYTYEVIDSYYDEDFEQEIETTRCTTHAYLLDSNGTVIYETVSCSTDDVWSITYEGEELRYCTEDRILTATYDTYGLGMGYSTCTVYMYDIDGKKIAEFTDVISFGSFINGKLILTDYASVTVVDRNGNVVSKLDDLYDRYPELYLGIVGIGNGHYTTFFSNGYALIRCECEVLLVSEDMKTTYVLDDEHIYSYSNYGTLVFSKVIQNGVESECYYLLDVSQCKTDENGMTIPTMDAVVCDTPVSYGMFNNYFGKVEAYAHISTEDGKWGFVSYDGKVVKLYDDAGCFSGGYAAVKDGNELYVIDENFNRVSNSISGYDSISTSGNSVFVLDKGDNIVIAVYTP